MSIPVNHVPSRSHVIRHWRALCHPRVFVFILTGTGIIFLTFCTTNNAVEIAISGIASIFIGIGVNNFSSFETRLKEEQKSRKVSRHTRDMMNLLRSKVSRLGNDVDRLEPCRVKDELVELETLISLYTRLIEEDGPLH